MRFQVMLSLADKQSMQSDVENVIISFGKTMMVYRSEKANTGSFAGWHQLGEILIGEYPNEQKLLSPKSLTEISADLVIVCAGQTDIKESDRIVINDDSFIVSHINPENAFGGVTHLEVNLEKDSRYGG